MAFPRKFTDQLQAFCELADRLANAHDADAMLFLMERPTDWTRLRQCTGEHTVILAGDTEETLEGSAEEDFDTILLNMPSETPVYERLTQALLEAVAEELLPAGATVVAVYSGFEPTVIDSLSIIRLGEHLGQLTVRDLRQLKTRIPLETLKSVVDLAVDIGREGREGKPVGTLFVVGDHRKVMSFCRPMGFDPLRGYSRADRNLADAKVREGVKEIAQLDGAFIVSSDGHVVAGAQQINAPRSTDLSLPKGFGARHWAAAELSRATGAVAITVSESTGTVRLFQNGEVMLRIEPFRRAMKWIDFDVEAPPAAPEKE
ncbi:MAG: DNA integrity scanning protein DisA nucleotide-binding domain protein [Planctomycetes bacterium]|nr:DNA integrity scanning protein DisA nucleotide-binding domain protein [Planctomycetota bacterium]